MTPRETGKLLAVAALFDSRKVDSTVVVAWHEILGGLPYSDCEAAVRAHYSDSTDRLMPAHVRDRVKAIRGARLDATEVPPPPAEIRHDAEAVLAWQRRITKAIADGDEVAVHALTTGVAARAITDGSQR